MSEVGLPIRAGNGQLELTNVFLNNRRMIRSTKNPLDRCTIVSIFPRLIKEEKFTIEEGHYQIDPGTYEKPSVLVVKPSSWWKDIDAEQPLVEIPVSSIQVSESVIKDYCNSMLGCNMGDTMPGLFYVVGDLTSDQIKSSYKKALDEAKEKQDRWYLVLVKIADSLWARSGGNPLVIWDIMRLAALSLNLNEKPWLKDYSIIEKVNCKACGALKDPAYPVCQMCKAIDMAHPAAKEIKFAV